MCTFTSKSVGAYVYVLKTQTSRSELPHVLLKTSAFCVRRVPDTYRLKRELGFLQVLLALHLEHHGLLVEVEAGVTAGGGRGH